MANETVDYYNTAQVDQSFQQSVLGNTSTQTHIYRETWKFDEDGFKQGTKQAILLAQQELQDKVKGIFQDLVDITHAADYQVTLDGVPIDKAVTRQI